MKKAFITLTVTLMTLGVYAQHHFKSATLVYRNGSTMHGLIDYGDWDTNPGSVLFQTDDDPSKAGTRELLTPRELSAFSIDDIETFEAATITNKYTGDLKLDAPLTLGHPETIQTDTVFLRQLCIGSFINLYVWEDNYITKYFIRNNATGEFSELIIDMYLNPANNGSKVITRKYMGQFSMLAQDPLAHNSAKVTTLLNRGIPYTESSFMKLTDLLNNRQKKPDARIGVSPYAGVALQGSWVSYTGNIGYFGTSKISLSPAVNAGLDVYHNRHVKGLRIRFNAGFSAGSYTASKDSSISVHERNVYNYKLAQYIFSFSTQLLLNIYNTPALRINLGAGAGINYSFYSSNNLRIDRTFYGIEGENENSYALRSIWVNAPVRAGVTLAGKFDIFAQYNICISPLTNAVYRSIRCSGFQLGVNYCF